MNIILTFVYLLSFNYYINFYKKKDADMKIMLKHSKAIAEKSNLQTASC